MASLGTAREKWRVEVEKRSCVEVRHAVELLINFNGRIYQERNYQTTIG
jgi:hypothetical protein